MYTVAHRSRNVTLVKIPYKDGVDQKFLLTADRHWDNPMSDWGMQRRHLEQAKKAKAGIIDIGDLFCAMQGKFDKRSNKSSVRREHQVDEYLDALVRTAGDFFEPFAKQFVVLGMGNHETAILKRHETNLTDRLVERLRRAGSPAQNGGYSGWVIFEFMNLGTGERHVTKLWYIHGYGGGGPVTRGVIQTNRRAVYLPDANIVISGHTHDEWNVPIMRTRLDDSGKQYLDEQTHVQVPTYKDEYGDGFGGWHIETGKPPKPLGATWLRFQKEVGGRLTYDLFKAR